jgi:hypothetical protein
MQELRTDLAALDDHDLVVQRAIRDDRLATLFRRCRSWRAGNRRSFAASTTHAFGSRTTLDESAAEETRGET